MSHDEFTKLFTHMNQRFDALEKTLETKADKASVDNYLYLLDAHEKRIEVLEDEKQATDSQLARHQRWTNELAVHVDHHLSA